MPKHDGRSLDHGTSEQIRILAVLRVREDGEKPGEIMKSLGLCRTTIYRWRRADDNGGVAVLKSSQAEGPQPKRTDKQKQKVRTWIVGKDPRQDGIDFALWTHAILAEMIGRKFGIALGTHGSRQTAGQSGQHGAEAVAPSL
ncbi:MAG: helix-turn-helix domain-containing protein [Verrucomicrobiales bacterium]|nr:helix-turn-helix domain-containing protein [Verrucomicrobiales bacterium]